MDGEISQTQSTIRIKAARIAVLARNIARTPQTRQLTTRNKNSLFLVAVMIKRPIS